MTHPLFKKEIFVETAFARRFQKMLQDAWAIVPGTCSWLIRALAKP
jgi:hypothetical protein